MGLNQERIPAVKKSVAWMACFLLTSPLAFAQDDAPPVAAAGRPTLEVLSVTPASGGILRPMEEATVTIRYSCPDGTENRIWAQPYWQGSYARNGFFEGSSIVTGSGELTRTVGAKAPTRIDAVNILMADASKIPILEISHPVELKWEGESLDPRANSPAPVAPMEKSALNVGEPFPPLSFTSLQGEAVDVAALKGKVVLVDFWATWCGPCRGEMPNLIAAYAKHHADGFEIVAISLDSDKGKLEAYIAENGMAWPQYFDGKGWKNEISSRLDIHSIPTAFLLDRAGIVRSVNLRGPALEAAVAELLK